MANVTICLGVCFDIPGSDVTTDLSNSSYYNQSTCALSPNSQALSTVLTAFVGSIITGISSGYVTAFFVAWTSWFAITRIFVVAIWELCEAILLQPLEGGEQFFDFWKPLRIFKGARAFDDPFFRGGAEKTSTTFLGWIGWIYSTMYAPTIEILWLVENWQHAPGSLKLVRALGIAVAALPLTVDTRSRYGDTLGKLLGAWARCLFNLMTATSCMTLGIVSAILMCLAIQQLHIRWYIIMVYLIFALVWMWGGMNFAVPHDETRSANTVRKILAGLAMGCFGGCFLAAPAFVLFMNAPSSPGVGLAEYVKCDSIATWKKLVALSP